MRIAGCPPPEYSVVCRCGKECPSGTCPVFCGNHVCCHDPNSGLSIYRLVMGRKPRPLGRFWMKNKNSYKETRSRRHLIYCLNRDDSFALNYACSGCAIALARNCRPKKRSRCLIGGDRSF